MNYNRLALLFFIMTAAILLVLAFHPAWSIHLQTDLISHYLRARHLVQYGSFKELYGNEYQPGALLFFASLSPILYVYNSVIAYTRALFVVNICLLAILAILYRRVGEARNSLIFILILLCTGPIILYRFEPFVMYVVVLAFAIFIKRKQPLISAFLLGVSALIKIFPAVWIPYLLLLAFNNKGWKSLIQTGFAFVLGYLLFFLLFVVAFGGSVRIWNDSFAFLSQCPVHTESIWGTVMTLFSKITTGTYAQGKGAWGIYGISPASLIGPLGFYNFAPIIPLVLFYLYLLLRRRLISSNLDIRILIITVMIFLGFGKIIHHQYTLWFMLLVPLVPVRQLMTRWWMTNIVIILAMSLLHQYVYPLHFFDFVNFYTSGANAHLFWMIALRNLLFIVVLLRFLRHLHAYPDYAEKNTNQLTA